MISMNRPSLGERESATTTRYAGFFVRPARLNRMWTATLHSPRLAGRRNVRRACVGFAFLESQPRREGRASLQLAHPAFHLLDALHHLLELRILFEQAVHVGDRRPPAPRDS